ncbi:MAG: DNA-binding protein [Anaeromicrobium sp.]|jgi:uncharacterized C2H2 Zn-finger protein|uniref:DVU_1557 family redox protein n=1 Tax=Anaeromicrobium sp. TaxID=1929132 RepID=UPI0025FC854B|nr:CLJU_RS11820 family redox protein [Anaeromicrobium sp.]MCT4594153.1 DNA-binding protein [Anaeromicrobium sp.]
MTFKNYDEEIKWICSKCGSPLKEEKVKLIYLGGDFQVELLKCPNCKLVLITEKLAQGKMLLVEQNLEDK